MNDAQCKVWQHYHDNLRQMSEGPRRVSAGGVSKVRCGVQQRGSPVECSSGCAGENEGIGARYEAHVGLAQLCAYSPYLPT